MVRRLDKISTIDLLYEAMTILQQVQGREDLKEDEKGIVDEIANLELLTIHNRLCDAKYELEEEIEAEERRIANAQYEASKLRSTDRRGH